MESYRLIEKNRILSELSSCRTRISRAENQLAELKKSTDNEYISAQTDKNQSTISGQQEKVQEFEQRLVDLAKGILDDEIMSMIQTNTSLVKQKNEKAQKKKAVKAENDSKNAKMPRCPRRVIAVMEQSAKKRCGRHQLRQPRCDLVIREVDCSRE